MVCFRLQQPCVTVARNDTHQLASARPRLQRKSKARGGQLCLSTVLTKFCATVAFVCNGILDDELLPDLRHESFLRCIYRKARGWCPHSEHHRCSPGAAAELGNCQRTCRSASDRAELGTTATTIGLVPSVDRYECQFADYQRSLLWLSGGAKLIQQRGKPDWQYVHELVPKYQLGLACWSVDLVDIPDGRPQQQRWCCLHCLSSCRRDASVPEWRWFCQPAAERRIGIAGHASAVPISNNTGGLQLWNCDGPRALSRLNDKRVDLSRRYRQQLAALGRYVCCVLHLPSTRCTVELVSVSQLTR